MGWTGFLFPGLPQVVGQPTVGSGSFMGGRQLDARPVRAATGVREMNVSITYCVR
jgi:hypothetical protein